MLYLLLVRGISHEALLQQESKDPIYYARILDPDSKLGTFDKLDSYYGASSFSYHDIHRFMEFMAPFYNDYISWLYSHSENIVERDSSVIYYDCTNFYFKTEECDEDYIDPYTGEVFTGLRKYGVSKEHRPNPVVQMGLVMDRKGIPLTMCIDPGNTNEQTTAIPLEKELVRMSGSSRFIYCADAGLGSVDIRRFIKRTDGQQAVYCLDEDRIAEKAMYDGYYAIATNLETDNIAGMIETLKNMNVVNISDMYYQAVYTNSQALKALEQLMMLTLDRKYYRPKELNRILKKAGRKE